MTYEEYVVGLKGIKPFLQEQMRLINYEGLGEFDAKEIGETIDVAISAVEKQIPKKPNYEADGYADGSLVYDIVLCPNCDYDFEDSNPLYCPHCGQSIDWSEE